MNSSDAGHFFLRQKLLVSIDMHMLSGPSSRCQFQTLSYFFVMLLTRLAVFEQIQHERRRILNARVMT